MVLANIKGKPGRRASAKAPRPRLFILILFREGDDFAAIGLPAFFQFDDDLHPAGREQLLRLRDIAHLTAIDNSTLSRLVSTLHKRRLLARRRSVRNKREVVITLTPKGREHMQMLIPAAVEHVERMTAGIPASDIETTKATLTRIFENLDTLPDRQPALKESVLKAL